MKRRSAVFLSDPQNSILLPVVYEMRLRFHESSFYIWDLVLLKQSKAADGTVPDLSVPVAIRLGEVDEESILPAFVIRHYFDKHKSLLPRLQLYRNIAY